ncbi:DUF2255 family protein [Isoptericola sp. BMS4]|uniref:DUF2255 family protein n=1 Tax=Isoptericola sp. BMS4 TaxID=2527875 RepID=UPI00141FB936|nr:DUF2255 family protein [Isoptericola sp. BMS4]
MAIASPRDLSPLAAAPTVHLVLSGAERAAKSWVVQLGTDLYVRTVPGAVSAWSGGGPAHLRLDGAEHPVVLSEVAPEVHGPLDDAYRAKYGRCAPEKVDAVTSDAVVASTFRVRPRRLPWWTRVAARAQSARRGREALPRVSHAGRRDVACPTC